jgi:threonine/homoserine/homoserine lactone efflux protein
MSQPVLLFQLSCWTAIIHALIPDHWLPFVLMARAQRWSDRRTIALVALAGFLHVLISIAFGAFGIAFGAGSAHFLAERTGRSLEFLAGCLLVFFGIGYGVWAHLREARVHGGREAGDPTLGHVHAHGHLLERWFRTVVTGGALVVIIGISPCALLVPILFAASSQGMLPLVAAGMGFALCTIGTMVIITVLALRGMRQLQLRFFTRYGDLIGGMLIAAVGVLVLLEEL